MKSIRTTALIAALVFLISCGGLMSLGAMAAEETSARETSAGDANVAPLADASSLLATTLGTTSPSDNKADPLGVPVSYGLRVLSARDEIVFSGLCGNELSFTAQDICRAMNLSSLTYITSTSLPSPEDGTLFVGATGAAVGQTVPASALSLMSFAPAKGDSSCKATMSFSVNGGGYEVRCKLCLLEKINYTPTVALAPSLSLEVMTYCDVPVMSSLSSYDPEGDVVTYEITGYASHGRVALNDKHTGAYTYTPDRGYVGKDSFTYVVRDEYGNYSTSAQVTVQVSATPASVTYADLDGLACASAAIRVSAAGIMNGIRVGADDYFRPDTAITRVEFLVTAMNAIGMDPSAVFPNDEAIEQALASLTDKQEIPQAMRGYVAMALKNGVISGKSAGSGSPDARKFCPQETITRAEAAVILSNLIGYAKQTTVSAFADADSMPDWSVPAMTSLYALGIMTSSNGSARARETMSRGDAAMWLDGTMRLIAGAG